MPGGYVVPSSGPLGEIKRVLEENRRDIEENGRASGTQTAEALQQIRDILDGIIGATNITVPGYVQAGSYGQFGGDLLVGGHIYTPLGRSSPVVTSYVAAYLDGAGRLGATPSSRRFKQDIAAWSPETQALFAITLYTFRYKAAVEELGEDAEVEVGVMAEDLHELGLNWLVVYDSDGLPFTVRYERIALLLIPTVQDHELRLLDLDQRLTAAGF